MPPGLPDPQAVLRGHAGEVQALDFDASERLLVSGDSLGEVRVWDLEDLRPAATLRLHSLAAGVLALRLFRCAGRRLLATQGRDGITLLWGCQGDGVEQLQLSEQPLQAFVRDSYSFCRLSVLAAEEPLPASSSQAGPEQQEQQRQRQLAEEFAAAVLAGDEPGSSCSAEGGADETEAAAAGEGPTGGSGSAAREPPSAGAAIWALHPCKQASAAQPPALLAIPGGDERTAEIMCCACGGRVAAFSGAAASRKLGMLMALQLYCCAPGGGGAAARPASGPAAAAAAAQPPAAAAAAASEASAGCPPPPRIYLAAGYEDGSVAVWDPSAPPGAPPLAERQLCKEPVTALAIDSAASGGAAGSAGGSAGGSADGSEEQLVVFKIDHSGGRLGVRYSEPLAKKGVGDVAVRPDRRLLAVGGWDGRVRLCKYRSGRPLAVLKYHSAAVSALRFAPRSQLLATAARDGTLALWAVYQPGE